MIKGMVMLVALMSCLPYACAADGWRGMPPGGEAAWNLPAELTEGPVSFEVGVGGMDVKAAGRGVELAIPGQAVVLHRGAPALPVVARMIRIPFGASVSGRVVGTDFEEFRDVTIAPLESTVYRFAGDEKPMPVTHRDPDRSIYSQDAFWPEDLVSVQMAWMGTQRLARIECRPVQYNPVSHTLRFHRRIRGELVVEAPP